MSVQYPGMKKEESRFGWRKIRIPFYVMKLIIIIVFLALLGGGGSYLWARHQGKESLVGRIMTVLGTKVGQSFDRLGDSEGEMLEQRYASLSFYSGNVEVQRSSELNWRGASEKMRLEAGDRIRTFSNSRAEIAFDDGTVLRVKPDSLIKIGELTENVRTKVRKSSVKLLVSSIEADIKKSVVKGSEFKIELPTAVAEVEKARFSINVNENQESEVKVFTGKVGIDTGTERVELDDRKTVMISALKKLSKPESILAAPRLNAPGMLARYFTNSNSMPVECYWEGVKGAGLYRLEIATDRHFDKVVFTKANIQKLNWRVPELGGNIFYARVAAIDARQRIGDYSPIVPFRVIVDRVPPLVEIQKFVVLKSGRSREVLVNGQTEPTATVAIGDREVKVDDSGFFSAVVKKLSPGQQEIEIVVRDRAGNLSNIRRPLSS